jgi:hypothetical protein
MRIGLQSGWRCRAQHFFRVFGSGRPRWTAWRGGAIALLSLVAACAWLAPAEASIDVLIDKRSQSMSVSIDGFPRYHWAVSTGRPGYATPSGSFGVTRMEEVYYSKKYDNAPMPNAVFFTNRGHAIHGTYETKRLGRAVSHGCVRLAPQNAATLFQLVEAEGLGNVRVTVVGNAPSSGQPRRLLPRIWPFEPAWQDDGPWEPSPMPQRRYRPLPFFGWNPWN